jgi:triacylglycerol lipase
MHRFGRRLVALGFAVALVIGGAVPAMASSRPPDPILLVHGYRGDPSTWADMIANFAAAGRTAEAIDLPSEDNIVNAKAIDAYVAAKGWTHVDIVAQSMGGLSARQYIKFLKPTVVDTYTSLGTPQYGIWEACILPSWYGGQMCPSSSFLRALNKGDDTPGGAYWTTIYSATDGIVPTSSSRLDGGACHVFENPGVGHNEMDNDPTIFKHVLAAVDRTCVGTFIK